MKFYFSSRKSVLNAESIRVRVAAVTVNTALYVHPDGPVACFFLLLPLFNGYVHCLLQSCVLTATVWTCGITACECSGQAVCFDFSAFINQNDCTPLFTDPTREGYF
jgi:hypothetical protein